MIVEKIINSLLYGSNKTKSYLWTILVLGIFALGCIIGGAAGGSVIFLVGGVVFAVLGVVVFQSISFREIVKEGEAIEKKKKKERKINQEVLLTENDAPKYQDPPKEKPREKSQENPLTKFFPVKSETEMKQLLYTYKVKKQHKKVIIDSSNSFRIRQCPAFMWKEKNELLFLLLEEEPRIIRISTEKIRGIGYEKMVQGKIKSDYEEFLEPGLIPQMFSEYLPKYQEVGHQENNQLYKNLYVIHPDIKLTNHSARNIFDVLEVDFNVEDRITMSPVYDDYFKMAYKAHILWMDEVISTSEYKEKIKVLLTALSSESLSKGLFEQVLQQLVSHKLITEEYAKYYRKLRK